MAERLRQNNWGRGVPRQPRDPVSPPDFIGRNWILPRDPIDFIGRKWGFSKMGCGNAEEIDNVKQQSLVKYLVRFTGRRNNNHRCTQISTDRDKKRLSSRPRRFGAPSKVYDTGSGKENDKAGQSLRQRGRQSAGLRLEQRAYPLGGWTRQPVSTPINIGDHWHRTRQAVDFIG